MWVTYASGACKWLGWQTERLQLQLQLQLRVRLSAVATHWELRPLDLSCRACHIVSKHRKIRGATVAVFWSFPFACALLCLFVTRAETKFSSIYAIEEVLQRTLHGDCFAYVYFSCSSSFFLYFLLWQPTNHNRFVVNEKLIINPLAATSVRLICVEWLQLSLGRIRSVIH